MPTAILGDTSLFIVRRTREEDIFYAVHTYNPVRLVYPIHNTINFLLLAKITIQLNLILQLNKKLHCISSLGVQWICNNYAPSRVISFNMVHAFIDIAAHKKRGHISSDLLSTG
jgi:hypothetical protein